MKNVAASADDGLVFDADTIDATFICEADIYGGIRVKLTARLASAAIPIQVRSRVERPTLPAEADES